MCELLDNFYVFGMICLYFMQWAGKHAVWAGRVAVLGGIVTFFVDAVAAAALAVIFLVGDDDVSVAVDDTDAVRDAVDDGLQESFLIFDFLDIFLNVIQHSVEGKSQFIELIRKDSVFFGFDTTGKVSCRHEFADRG